MELLDLPEDPGATTSALVGLLGTRLGELHRALAVDRQGASNGSRAFVPEPATLLWQRSVLQHVRSGIRTTQRLLRRMRASLDASGDELTLVPAGELAGHLLAAAPDEVLARFEPVRTRKFDFLRIRVHGDLHLGQVLWTGRDVVFIDFEGEPARPIGERTIRRSPLVDVAGLVRSLDYAGRQAVLTAVQRGVATGPERQRLEAWRAAWTTHMTEVLVASYARAVEGTGLVPSDPSDTRLLLDLYVLDKALYEVRYEAANRPAWIGWPLAAVDAIVTPAEAGGRHASRQVAVSSGSTSGER